MDAGMASSTNELAEFFAVAEEDITAYVKEFHAIDKNKDGKITVEELKSGMASFGCHVTTGEAKTMIEFVDVNNDNKIDLMEYLNMITRAVKSRGTNVEQEALQAFARFDMNHDGFISINELRKTMATLGQRLTQKEANQIVKLYDKNKDGRIDYKEFLNAWKQVLGKVE